MDHHRGMGSDKPSSKAEKWNPNSGNTNVGHWDNGIRKEKSNTDFWNENSGNQSYEQFDLNSQKQQPQSGNLRIVILTALITAAVCISIMGAYLLGVRNSSSSVGEVQTPDSVKNEDDIGNLEEANGNMQQSEQDVADATQNVVDASQNQIVGIDESKKYTTNSKITFEAVGTGMDNLSPVEGDRRYRPVGWLFRQYRFWNGGPYIETLRMGKAGTYTIKVTFQLQIYQDGVWTDTGEFDTKEKTFTVAI